ncbi:MAG: GNAT family N-acetyltransferase [Clostridia bacterium]|nr:GNAT family N-acetyltransferase [Clostridia bacterium]
MERCFRQATGSDISQMMELWRLCFPEDEEGFIRRFFQKMPTTAGFVACKGDVLASLFLLPAEVLCDGRTIPVRYLYAGCTHPAHRRQGIYADLMQYAGEQAKKDGAEAIYLHPATEPLAGYYRRLGYHPGIGWYRTATAGELSVSGWIPLTAEEYMKRRSRFYPERSAVWQLHPECARFFLEEMMGDGWQPMVGESGCGVLSPDGTVLYDCLSSAGTVGGTACGLLTAGEWENTALWLPLGESEFPERGYTAFLGDI